MLLYYQQLHAKKIISDLPVADDGYLYIYAAGQSNMVGTWPYYPPDSYPVQNSRTGDMTNPIKTFTIDPYNLDGNWIPATYQNIWPWYNNISNNIALTFCRELEKNYPDLLGIRLLLKASGSTPVDSWLPPDGHMWLSTASYYDSFSPENIRPAAIWLWHQGEDNAYETYEEYNGKLETVRQGLISSGYLHQHHTFICGELARNVAFNNVLKEIADSNIRYKVAHGDGLEKGDIVHYLGTGLDLLGKRYLERFYEVVLSKAVPDDLIRPNRVYMTVSNLTSLGFTLSWTAATTNNVNRTIVGYKIFNFNGYILYNVVGLLLTIDVLHSKESGETENWNVQAYDDLGNTTPFLASNPSEGEIIIP